MTAERLGRTRRRDRPARRPHRRRLLRVAAMLYDVRLELHYDYEGFVHGDRHLVRVAPQSDPRRAARHRVVDLVRSAP